MDEEDEFYYDVVPPPPAGPHPSAGALDSRAEYRSFASEVLDASVLPDCRDSAHERIGLSKHRPQLARLVVAAGTTQAPASATCLSLLARPTHETPGSSRMLDDTGVPPRILGFARLSKFYENPYVLERGRPPLEGPLRPGGVRTPACSAAISNGVAPFWMPMNFLIIESFAPVPQLLPATIQDRMSGQVGQAGALGEGGRRSFPPPAGSFCRRDGTPAGCWGSRGIEQRHPFPPINVLFYEYFHGDTGRGPRGRAFRPAGPL